MVASFRSGDIFTSGTVMMWPSRSASRALPCARMSEIAWRTISPTRNCRCEPPVEELLLWWRIIRPFSLLSFSEADARPGKPGTASNNFQVSLFTKPQGSDLQAPLNGLDAITLDDITDSHVAVILECHAAFLAGLHFLHFVLEALQRRQLAFVHHNVVPNQADIGTAFHGAVSDAAARDLANLGDVEHFQDLGVAEHGLAQCRREQAGHRLL